MESQKKSRGVERIVDVSDLCIALKFVANLWTEFAAHRGEALATSGKELQNP
jgi:hypothetical protein